MIEADEKEAAIRRTFFRREAEILRFLQSSPIVPRLYELIEADKSAYLVMEFIPGQNLLEILEKPGGRPFAVAQVARSGAKICEVLAHMHRQNPPVVHRDPETGQYHAVSGWDHDSPHRFRHGPRSGKDQQGTQRAQDQSFHGGLCPAQQVIGKPEPRSDLFALAGTLYHLATGKAPEGFFTAREISQAPRFILRFRCGGTVVLRDSGHQSGRRSHRSLHVCRRFPARSRTAADHARARLPQMSNAE